MRADGPEAPGELIAARVIGKRPTLKDDQREMVRRLLVDSEGVVVVIGEAGTGKTYATVAAAEGWGMPGWSSMPAPRPGARPTSCAPRDCRRRASPPCLPTSTGVRTIEGFRQEHGVKDPDRALGRALDSSRSAEPAREQAQQRFRQSQRELGRIKEAARTRDMDLSLGIGR